MTVPRWPRLTSVSPGHLQCCRGRGPGQHGGCSASGWSRAGLPVARRQVSARVPGPGGADAGPGPPARVPDRDSRPQSWNLQFYDSTPLSCHFEFPRHMSCAGPELTLGREKWQLESKLGFESILPHISDITEQQVCRLQ